MLSGETAGLDWSVLAFTAALTVVSGLVCGVAPALVWSQVDLRGAMSEAVTTTAGSRRALWIRRSLAGAEMALACMLLVGGGLLVRTLLNLHRIDLGINPQGVTIARMSLQGAVDRAAFGSFVVDSLERVRRIPGVAAASASSGVPVERAVNLPLSPPAGSLIAEPRAVDWSYVTADYFRVFGIPVAAGRSFDERDGLAASPIAIVNEAFARAYFGRVDVVGETIGLVAAFKDPPRQIVGVVGDVKARTNTNWTEGLTAHGSGAPPMIYIPAGEGALSAVQAAFRVIDVVLSVRSDRPPGEVAGDLRNALEGVDGRAMAVAFEPMDAVIARDLDIPRLVTNVLATFAALAVALAAIGLYGLMAYAAARRRREVGIRMAFGATTAGVLRQFMTEGVIVAAIGLALGAAGASLVTDVITGLLFGVTPLDVSTYAAVGGALLATAGLASLVPAIRASRTNPVLALRSE
jgi:predicted permease